MAFVKEKNKRDRDSVNNPEHYNIAGVECKDLIEARGSRACGFYWGNALKYLIRAGEKDGEEFSEAVKKARRNLTYLIDWMDE